MTGGFSTEVSMAATLLTALCPRNQSLLVALEHSFQGLSKGPSTDKSLYPLGSPRLWHLPSDSRSHRPCCPREVYQSGDISPM